MIARISGRLEEVSEGSALVDVGGGCGMRVSQGQTSITEWRCDGLQSIPRFLILYFEV